MTSRRSTGAAEATAADTRAPAGEATATAATAPTAAAPGRAAAPARKPKPDPRPMRAAAGIAAVAAASVTMAGMVLPAWSSDASQSGPDGGIAKGAASAQAGRADRSAERAAGRRRIIRYVQLRPGQKAPPGARVIRAAEPTPRVVVVASHSTATRRQPPRVVVRTRQSG